MRLSIFHISLADWSCLDLIDRTAPASGEMNTGPETMITINSQGRLLACI